MTKLNYADKRKDVCPTFGDLEIGDLFTSVNGKEVFIKTAVMYNGHKDAYNTVSLDGEFYWSDDEEEIEPIQEIEITIKR